MGIWTGITNNQGVAFTTLSNAIQGEYFLQKNLIPFDTNELITKSDADTYVYINTGYTPYNSKQSNQILVKSDLQGGFRIYGPSAYGCVVPNSNILITPDSTSKAENLNVGDFVYTKHENTNTWGYYRIEKLDRKEQPTVTIRTNLGDIKCSTTHLLLSNGEYIESKELNVGDKIEHIDGEISILEIIEENITTVIEFTIEDAHTYVADGFISHNKCIGAAGHNSCLDACSGGITSYYTFITYEGKFASDTSPILPNNNLINVGSCPLQTSNKFYYYPGGYLEIGYSAPNYYIVSKGTCPCPTPTPTVTPTSTPTETPTETYTPTCEPYGTFAGIGCKVGPDCLDTQAYEYFHDGNCGFYDGWYVFPAQCC